MAITIQYYFLLLFLVLKKHHSILLPPSFAFLSNQTNNPYPWIPLWISQDNTRVLYSLSLYSYHRWVSFGKRSGKASIFWPLPQPSSLCFSLATYHFKPWNNTCFRAFHLPIISCLVKLSPLPCCPGGISGIIS